MSDDMTQRSDAEIEAWHDAWLAERAERVTQLRRDARAVFSAIQGWQRVQSEDDWLRTNEEAQESYRTGRFLIERLGAERFLEPELMAVLVQLRRGLVGTDGGDPSEAMAADLAVTSYYNSLRLQQWIGDLAIDIEREFFGVDAPSARFDGRYGKATGLVVEERLKRLGEQLLPLQERANRMMLRNLKALADLRRAPAPAVAIGQAGQVNLGHGAQINVSRDAVPPEDAVMPAEIRVRTGASER
jgi:hypothetical protein